jgi:hypothetical protein
MLIFCLRIAQEFYNLTLEGCDFNCDFANFTRFFEPIVQPNQTQWEKECENVSFI